jgi:hypothetical protein
MKEPYLTFRGYFPVTGLIRECRPQEIPGISHRNHRLCYRKHLFQKALLATGPVELDFLREFSGKAGKNEGS